MRSREILGLLPVTKNNLRQPFTNRVGYVYTFTNGQ